MVETVIIPNLCQECHKYHYTTVVKACLFCRDVQFPEQVLCDLVRDNDGDEQPFHCEAFRPTLSVVPHDETDTSPTEDVSENTVGVPPQDKWFRAYAGQQLGVDPDLIYTNIQYHVVFSTRQRVNVFASAHGEQIADRIRQAALPFEQTIVHVVWLASDHLHLSIDASPEYAMDTNACHQGAPGTRNGKPSPRIEAQQSASLGTSVLCRRYRGRDGLSQSASTQ